MLLQRLDRIQWSWKAIKHVYHSTISFIFSDLCSLSPQGRLASGSEENFGVKITRKALPSSRCAAVVVKPSILSAKNECFIGCSCIEGSSSSERFTSAEKSERDEASASVVFIALQSTQHYSFALVPYSTHPILSNKTSP